jgi:hypothetical protein
LLGNRRLGDHVHPLDGHSQASAYRDCFSSALAHHMAVKLKQKLFFDQKRVLERDKAGFFIDRLQAQ